MCVIRALHPSELGCATVRKQVEAGKKWWKSQRGGRELVLTFGANRAELREIFGDTVADTDSSEEDEGDPQEGEPSASDRSASPEPPKHKRKVQ